MSHADRAPLRKPKGYALGWLLEQAVDAAYTQAGLDCLQNSSTPSEEDHLHAADKTGSFADFVIEYLASVNPESSELSDMTGLTLAEEGDTGGKDEAGHLWTKMKELQGLLAESLGPAHLEASIAETSQKEAAEAQGTKSSNSHEPDSRHKVWAAFYRFSPIQNAFAEIRGQLESLVRKQKVSQSPKSDSQSGPSTATGGGTEGKILRLRDAVSARADETTVSEASASNAASSRRVTFGNAFVRIFEWEDENEKEDPPKKQSAAKVSLSTAKAVPRSRTNSDYSSVPDTSVSYGRSAGG